ncbi:MAG: tetratricopeptide repeat protein [Proteobacteria bacterium]|nr:tetratricopeptide repeat protein [Pseudomonadota bacterium]
MRPESQERNPYVGPRPFEKQDKGLFFGRDREDSEILSLIIAHRTLLLYAQSGAGKTSLLNARLVPLLEEEGFEVLPLARVRGLIPEGVQFGEIPNLYVFNTLMSWSEKEADAKRLAQLSLAGFLKEREHPTDEDGQVLPRAIIFDQFEELFSFYPERWEEREGFFRQVAQALKEDSLLRVLFVIREDYLASFDPYVELLPERVRTRYRLERLRGKAARRAIEGPLQDTGRSFEKEVASSLVQELVKSRVKSATGEVVEAAGEYVEPVQLQIVCKNLWDSLPPDVTVITSDHLHTFGDVDEALKSFYERAVEIAARETGVKKGDIRTWFDSQLITPAGTRGTVFRGQEYTGTILNSVVDALENQHIIRAELRAGARWYELTHDRLIEPIQTYNEVWHQRQQAEEQQRQIEMEQQRAEEQQRRAEKQARVAGRLRRLSVALATVFLISVGLAVFAFFQWQKAWDAERVAQMAQAEAEAQGQVAQQQAKLAEKRRLEAVMAKDIAAAAQKRAEVQSQRAEKQANLSFARELAAAAINNLDVDPERSILLALQAVSISRSVDKTVVPEAENALHLALQASRVRLNLSGHKDKVNSVAFSPDATCLATASSDGTIKIWDAQSGKELLNLSTTPVIRGWLGVGFEAITVDLANKLGVQEGAGILVNKVIEGDPADKAGIKLDDIIVKLNGKEVNLGNFVPVIAGLAPSSSAQIELIRDGQFVSVSAILGERPPEKSAFTCLAFSPDGVCLSAACSDGTARVWDVASGKELLTLSGHTDEVCGVAFSPDGTCLATASFDSTAKVWDASSGKELLTLSGHTDEVCGVAFSPDGTRLATASRDLTGKVWDAASGKELLTLSGHTGEVFGIAFSPDGTRLATAGRDLTGKVWDAASGKELPITLSGHTNTFLSVAFSPDGTRLATASWDNTAKVWDAASGKKLLTLSGHTNCVRGVAFSPDGTRLVTASDDKTAKVWDVTSGRELLTLSGHTGEVVWGVAFSPDGTRLATASWDNTAKVWDASSGRELLTLSGHTGEVWGVAFSPDGTRLATASTDETGKVWDAASGKELFTLAGHTGTLLGIAFSPDGTRLATASMDNTGKVWDASSGKKLFPLSGHTGGLPGIAFSPDGTRLATASMDKTAKVWDAVSDRELLTLVGHINWVTDVVFGPDGTRLATASRDGTVRLYALNIEDLVTLARTRVTRSLTSKECKKYLHEVQCPPTVVGLIVEGRNLARAGDVDGAVASFQKALKLDPALVLVPEAEAERLAAQTLVAKGQKLIQQGKAKEAIGYLEKAISLNPVHDMAHLILGTAYKKMGEYDKAIDHLQKAIEIVPTLYSYAELIETFLLKKDYDQTFSLVTRALKQTKEGTGKCEDAINACNQVKETDPAYGFALAYAGVIYVDYLFKYEKAYQKFKQLLELNPKNIFFIANFAGVNLITGRFKEAYSLAQKVLAEPDALQPLSVSGQLTMRFIMISSLIMQGNTGQAYKALEEFISYYKNVIDDYKPEECSYTGTKHFITQRSMNENQRKLLLKLIDILETPTPDVNIKQFKKLFG